MTELYLGNDFEIPRLYWNAGEVASELSINIVLVRAYAKMLNLKVGRSRQNYRMFTRQHIGRLTDMVKLIRFGLTPEAAVKYMDRVDKISTVLS